MKHHVRCAVPFGRCRTKIEPVPSFAGTPVAYLARRRDDLNAGQDVLEAERVQDAGPIRAELNASSNLLERVRLLVHIDIDATLE